MIPELLFLNTALDSIEITVCVFPNNTLFVFIFVFYLLHNFIYFYICIFGIVVVTD